MRKLKFSLLTLLTTAVAAIMTVAAVGATSAMAANPEFKSATAFPIAFEGGSAEVNTLETAKHKIVCSGGNTTKGSVAGKTLANEIVVVFTHCEETATKVSCENKGAGSKDIETKPLEAEPAFINGKHAAKEERGLPMKPESGSVLAKFTCSIVTVEVTGSVIGVVAAADVGVLLNEFEVNFNQKAGTQEPTEYELEEPAGSGTFVKHADSLTALGEKAGQEAHKNKLKYPTGVTVELT